MDPLVYSTKFLVKGHDVNVNKVLTIPALLKYLQEASLQHARNLKTSVWDMKEDKLTWVLVRKELKVIQPLRMDESYTILTYPSGFDKFLAYRDYLVFDSNKKIVVGASSTWTLIQTDERKLMKIPQNIQEIGTPKDTRFLTQPNKTISLPSGLKEVDKRVVRPYDLDWNNHVNNIVLIRFAMEALKAKEIEDDQIQKVLVHFKNELHLGDQTKIFLAKEGNTYFSKLSHTVSDNDIAICQFDLYPQNVTSKG